MADELIKTLIVQATSILQQHIGNEWNRIVNVEADIHELLTTLESIQAKVNDAEKREIESNAIKLWVRNLKLTSYDIHDALTDWSFAIREVNGNTSRPSLRNKVCLAIVFPCFFSKSVALLRDVASKINGINRRLASIDADKNDFGFASSIPSVPNDQETLLIEPQSENEIETTSFVDPSTILGRDNEKSILLSKLKSKGNPALIFIWGMGGIGKTTFAQLLFHSLEVPQDLDIKMWVSVGRLFDTKSVAKAIVKQAVKDGFQDCSDLQTALDQVHRAVNNKKYLLVLDNVWAEDQNGFEPLFVALKGGAPGSKILITSRNEEVGTKFNAIVQSMGLFSVPSLQDQMKSAATSMHHLVGLLDEDTWTIFKRFAFSGRNDEFYQDLKATGRKISDKCKGLPLAAKILGSLMVLKNTVEEWNHALDDNIWELAEEEGERLSRPLLFSYYELPPAIKRCFCYCANFPKDSEIDAANLIQIWMSQGYLGSSSTRSDEMEITGRGYLNSLVTRSFFQDPERDKGNGTVVRFKMHDVVHDLANYLMEDECLMGKGTINEVTKNQDLRPWMSCRHLTITREDNATFQVPDLNKLERLYTLLVQCFHDCPQIVVTQDCLQFPFKFFDHFKYLKTLDMGRNMLSTLPNDVEKLKNLCYLNLSHNPFYKLPETICSLTNLQTLKLVACRHLTELPQSIGKLQKLRHLEIDDTRSLKTLPRGVANLTSLRTLSQFLIGEDKASCSLGDLRDLNHLRGCLKIQGLNSADESQAMEAELGRKEHLVDLHINCSSASSVIDALQLNIRLVSLQIDQYGGQWFPSWVAYLTNLKKLRLQDWDRCERLPPLGTLPSLKILHIEGLNALVDVGPEFLEKENDLHEERGVSVATAFRKLEKLKFSHMENWKEWNVMKEIKIMPCLRYLKLSNCQMLWSLPQEVLCLPIKKLRIRSCDLLKQRYQNERGEEASHISNVRIR